MDEKFERVNKAIRELEESLKEIDVEFASLSLPYSGNVFQYKDHINNDYRLKAPPAQLIMYLNVK